MAAASVLAPVTPKQPSRKGKKAWRKNVDLVDLEAGLENVREEIITGGIVAEKSSEEIFIVDNAGDQQIAKSQSGKKLLKADEILAQRSAVPAVDGTKKRKTPATISEIASVSKKSRDGKYISHKELQRIRSVADNAEGIAIDEYDATRDLWGTALPDKHDSLDFVSQPRPARAPKSLRQAPTPLTFNGKALPAVRKPEAGKSYNPLARDWSEILEREGEAAVQAERKRLDTEAAEAEKERRIEEEIAKAEAAERDDWATDYESEWDGFQSEGERESHTAKTQRRKTPAERNKIKARKQREAQELWERKQKARDQQERMIKQIAKEVSTRDKARNAGLQPVADFDSSDSDHGVEPALQRRRFGKVAVPEAPLEVVLPDELQESLRRLRPEGDLLTDRYRTLLINVKLEVRKRRGQHRQAKTTRSEKWSYTDWTL